MKNLKKEEAVSIIRKISKDNSNSIILIPEGTDFYHSQKESYKEAFFFQRGFNHRFADKREKVGLMYFAFDQDTALLESLKKRVLIEKDVEDMNLYKFRLKQDILVANIPVYSTYHGVPYEQLVDKENGPSGYSRTQEISTAIMAAELSGVVGLSYHSRENPNASFGCLGQCMALFEGNESLFDVVDKKPLKDLVSSNGQTVYRLLASYGKRFEDVPV